MCFVPRARGTCLPCPLFPPSSEQSPAHERHSDETLFSCPGVFKPCGCRNKVYDLKKAVTCFLGYLASCADLCGDGKESGFHQEYAGILLRNFWRHGFTHRLSDKLLSQAGKQLKPVYNWDVPSQLPCLLSSCQEPSLPMISLEHYRLRIGLQGPLHRV